MSVCRTVNDTDGSQVTKTYTSGINVSTAYRYHWIKITHVYGANTAGAAAMQMYVAATPLNMTLVSDTFTAQSEPTTVRAVILHEPVVAVTINTDLITEVSIDNGVTWAAITLTNEGVFSTGINMLAGGVDVTAQTGTSIKYRHRTANTKEQKIHATWLQWS